MRDQDDKARARLEAIEVDAVAAGSIAAVGVDRDERLAWQACDVASLVEGCFHQIVDPATLDDRTARPWLERLGRDFAVPSVDRWDEDRFDAARRYWILDAGRRAGTITLRCQAYTGPWLSVHSLYVLPEHRGRALAGRLLDRLAQAAARQGLAGIRLSTAWTWQRSLRFYLSRGFWVRMWKHDIQLVLEPALPPRRFTSDGDTASLDVVADGEPRPLFTARRQGDLLSLEEARANDDVDFELRQLAVGTFAMLLALAGWPLVRSEEHWARRYHSSDAGEAEGLAYKIGVFEDVAREHGWVVDTPPIPGLDRWQAWARGEEHGEDERLHRDLAIVLGARGWQLDDARREQLRALRDWFSVEDLLRRAVTAADHEQWWQVAEEMLARRR